MTVAPLGLVEAVEDAQSDGAAVHEAPDERRIVLLRAREAEVNDEVAGELSRLDEVYQRGGQLVCVIEPPLRDVSSAPRIYPLPLALLREKLTKVVRFVKVNKRGTEVDAHPTDWCVRAVAARGSWPEVPVLRAVVEWPVLRPDGTILQEAGYDEATALLYLPQATFPPVPERPTGAQVTAALDALFDLVADFPFAGPEHRAAWLAGLLTPFARYAFDGPTPFFLVDANVRGAGKGLLCDVVATIATGRGAEATTQVTDEAEERKRITAFARSGTPFVLIDNISRPFGNGVLDAALTKTSWGERILGETNIPSLPLTIIWWGTGNNVSIRPHADTWRRILPIRLDSPHQNPETRTDFKHPDLLKHVLRERARYTHAALTLLRAFCAFGDSDDLQVPPWGSYPGWSGLVRRAVVWLGLEDPYKAHEALTQQADTTAAGLDGLVHGWREMCELQQVQGCTTREALAWLAEDLEWKGEHSTHQLRFERLLNAVLELCPPHGRPLPDARALGYTLRNYRGRVVDGYALDVLKEKNIGQQWTVTQRKA